MFVHLVPGSRLPNIIAGFTSIFAAPIQIADPHVNKTDILNFFLPLSLPESVRTEQSVWDYVNTGQERVYFHS